MSSVCVPSLSTPGRQYEVSRRVSGLLACDCTRYAFSKQASKGCRHVELVSKADAILANCAATHRSLVGQPEEWALCRTCLVALLALSARKVRRDYVTKAIMREKVAAARRRRKKRTDGKQTKEEA